MRFTKLKTYNTSLNPLAQPPATPQVHPHCQGDHHSPNDHQVQNQLQFKHFDIKCDLNENGMGKVFEKPISF